MRDEHYYGIDWARAIACIGIVMMHMMSSANNSYDCGGFLATVIIPSFTDFVFLFMTISAFGLCVGYYEKVKSGNISWRDFYKKRYIKIAPFFAVVVFLDVIVSFSFDKLIEGYTDITLLFGLFPNEIKVIGVGWFLGLIFAFYIMFPFFCSLIDSKKSAWFFLVGSIVLSVVCEKYFQIGRSNVIFCLPFFIAGGLVYLYREQLSKINWYLLVPVTVGAIIMYYCIGTCIWTNLLISTVLLIQAISIPVRYCSIIGFISGISMEIYLSHMVIFRLIERFHINTAFGNGWNQYIITVGLVLLGAIAFSVVINTILNCLKRKWTKQI